MYYPALLGSITSYSNGDSSSGIVSHFSECEMICIISLSVVSAIFLILIVGDFPYYLHSEVFDNHGPV